METMSRTLLFASVVLAGSFLTQVAAGTPDDPRPVPRANVKFRDETGATRDGTRCAAAYVNPKKPSRQNRSAETAALAAAELATAGGAMIEIPVAFHVVYAKKRNQLEGNVPDSQIDAQIQGLNDALQPFGFSFYLASVDRTNNSSWYTGCYNSSTESAMKQALAVDPPTTLNIYTCNPSQGVLGYAYYPSSLPEDSFLHGVVVLYSSLPGGTAVPYDEGDTATHEVGHYLGLRHTFLGGCTPPGDEIDDTPAESTAAFDCPVGRDTCPEPGLDPIHNFMDYTDDFCMFEFTGGQGTRMQAQTALYKPSLGTPPPSCGDGSCDADEMCSCASDCGVAPASEVACSDAVDNDCDGQIDCADGDCLGSPVCPICSSNGAACSVNTECCSGRCKGKPGQKTCQ
jgi:hypothetical protein